MKKKINEMFQIIYIVIDKIEHLTIKVISLVGWLYFLKLAIDQLLK